MRKKMTGSNMVLFPIQRWVLALVALATAVAAGCGSPVAEFRPNVGFQLKSEAEAEAQLTDDQQNNIATILEGLFGTPDEPHIPEVPDVEMTRLLDQTAIEMASGPVHVDEDGRTHGLFRRHCAHCHGITGDGMGPTAEFLNPYPRDYRSGIFKFKSTVKNARPTRADLHRILREGIPGTAMPSFRVLPEDQKDALVQYVIYLSMRGELERLLVPETLGVGELGIEGDQLFLNLSDKGGEIFTERSVYIREQLAAIGNRWLNAESAEVPAPPENWGSAESLVRGRELFFGKGACSGCHGNFGLGDGNTTFSVDKPFLDDWTKENWPEVKDKDEIKRQRPIRAAAGILEKRPLRPRNLRLGVYRGGRRPIDLYYRLRHGIEGTPMPALEITTGDDDPKKLTAEDIWSILDYVRNLPFEPISQPHKQLRNLKRERL
jgi:mono/diheme cytochrome c family protein